jgi:glycolate oxidase iron-sulfur subunit
MDKETQDRNKVLSAFMGIDIPKYGDILNCMHCGLCLSACPTYSLVPIEKAAPRGRIALIKAVAEGELQITDGFVEAMDFCLNCRACESACPAGVKYGELQEAARAQIEISGHGTIPGKLFKRFMLGTVFTSSFLLKSMGYSLWLYQKTGMQWLVRKTRVLEFLMPSLAKIEKLSPDIRIPFSDKTIPADLKPVEKPRYRVGLLTGCIMNMAFPDVNEDTAEVLVHNGFEVITPKDQVCCGSLHGHNGDLTTARKLARKNIEVFERAGVDYIIINSAGCGSFMKTYAHLLREEPEYAERAKIFQDKVKDISEFLVMAGFKKPEHAIPCKATYDDACHLLHGQGISKEPRQVLSAIPGLELIELEESSWCCGSAGIYNVVHYDDSMKILDRKMDHIKETQATLVITGNPGCLLQLNHGIKRHQQKARAIHPVTLLNMAYKGKQPEILEK